ncbi:MAG TPA: 50S ribosomal protein L25 [Acidimicrobiales bacterium]|jgi:large subunit ribosomal protein L25|nr:50S ribosomal protein L25 [Acidimicrobiales bacterium]
MAEITLSADSGRALGSRSSGRLRAAGKIPGVVYGHGIEPLPVAVDARALRAALTTDSGLNALLNIEVDGASHLTLARELQRHPVRHTVVHVDFQVVRRDEVISAEVPLALVGEAEKVHRGDGVVEQQLFGLTVHAVPARIPNSIEIDISGLAIGDTVRVGDLPLPSGVTTDTDPEVTVVVAQPPQVSDADLMTEAEQEAAQEAEAAQAEAEAEGGEAPTAASEGGEG